MMITQATDMKSTCQRYWNHVVTDSVRIWVASFMFELTVVAANQLVRVLKPWACFTLFFDDLVASDLKQSSMLRTKPTDSSSRFWFSGYLWQSTDLPAGPDGETNCGAKRKRQNNRVWIDSRANGYKNSTSLCLSMVLACINDDNVWRNSHSFRSQAKW